MATRVVLHDDDGYALVGKGLPPVEGVACGVSKLPQLLGVGQVDAGKTVWRKCIVSRGSSITEISDRGERENSLQALRVEPLSNDCAIVLAHGARCRYPPR